MHSTHGTHATSIPAPDSPTHPTRRRRPRSRVHARLAIMLIAAGMVVTACHSGSSHAAAGTSSTPTGGGTVSASPTTTGSSSSAGAQKPSGPAYAQCMRSHGVTSFPDPQGPNQDQFLISGAVQNDPHFAAASTACQALRPQTTGGAGGAGGVSQQQLLAFAQCMRVNGVPKFPDPAPNGAISIGGVDTSSPQFQQALQTCEAKTGLQLGGQ